MRAFLNAAIDVSQLQEMKKASSLVEAPNIENRPDKKKLNTIFEKTKNIKERNSEIIKAYEEGYSQQMIADVLEITQQAVHGVIKRSRY